jgi:hypothetical protein
MIPRDDEEFGSLAVNISFAFNFNEDDHGINLAWKTLGFITQAFLVQSHEVMCGLRVDGNYCR